MYSYFRKIRNISVNSLFFKLMVVFLTFFILPVLIASFVFYNYSTRTVENEVKQANNSLLKHACELTDEKLAEIQRTVFELSGRYYVTDLLNPIFTQEESTQLLSYLIDNLQDTKSSNSFINGIFIYYKADNFLVTNIGKMDFDVFFNRICSYEGKDLGYWQDLFTNWHTFEFLDTAKVTSYNMEDKIEASRNLVTVITTLPFNERPKAVVGVQINESSIQGILDNIGLTKKGNVYIIGKDGMVVSHSQSYTDAGEEDPDFLKAIKEKESGDFISKRDGKVMVSYITSKFTGWTYVVEIPYSEISQSSTIIKIVTVIICLFFILTGITISLKVSRWVYNPIKDLVNRLHKNAEGHTGVQSYHGINEINAINNGIDSIITQNKKLESILDSNMEGMRQKFLFDLIHGKFSNEEFLKYKAKESGIGFKYKYYTIAAVKFEFFKRAYIEFSLIEIDKIETGLCKLINGYADNGESIANTIETSKNDYAIIINSNSNDIGVLKQGFIEMIQLLNFDMNHVRLSISITSFTENPVNIPKLYEETCKALNYRVLNSRSQLIDFNDLNILMKKSDFYYPSSIEEGILNLMLAGSYEKALEEVYRVVDINIESGLPYEFLKESLTALLNTLVKAVKSKNVSLYDMYGSEVDIYFGLRNFSNVEEVKEFFRFAYEKAGIFIQKSKRSSNEKLLKQIIDYLNESYNKDIFLEQVSENVGASPKYISRFFKEQTGLNFIDYINKLRIQKAKELLKLTDEKVQDICIKVGFDNVNSFIRTFKRYEGISPGQYKEL